MHDIDIVDDMYAMEIGKNELSQKVWEALPSDLDGSKVKKCECCGETLALEYYDTEEGKTCSLCIAKLGTGFYDLNLDYKILDKFSVEDVEQIKEDFKEVLENVDVDVESYIAMYSSFSNFLRYAWYHLGLPKPTKAQIHFCDYLQYTNDHTIVNAFRGIGKSWITSVFVVWKLWLNPDLKILVISASKERADSFSIFTKRLLQELPVLHDLIPNGERQSNKAFDVGDIAPAHAPSVKSAGITGQITGSRADIIIADDVEVIDNSGTEDAREKLIEKCKDFVSILTPKEESRIIYLGTPQTEESIYDKLSEMGYVKFIIPSRYPEKLEKYKGYLASFIVEDLKANPELVGRATDPERFSDEELLSRELLIGSSTFALQFQLDTELSDRERYPLRLSDLIVTNLDAKRVPSHISYASSKYQQIKDLPNYGFSGDRLYEAGFIEEPYVEYQGMAMFIDPSGRGTDETTYAVIGQYMGRLHLIGWGGFQGTGYSDEVMSELAFVIRDNNVKVCIIEDNFGDGMFTKLFAPVVRRIAKTCAIEEFKTHSNKEKRIIDSIEPVMNQHRLVINREAIKREIDWVEKDKRTNLQYSLLYQLTHITAVKGALKHDDRLDALAGCIKYWTDFMNKDVELAIRTAQLQREEAERQRLIEIHNMNTVEGKKKSKNSVQKLLKRGGSRSKSEGSNLNCLRRRK